MHPLQLIAVGVNLSRLCLLAGVYFASASVDNVYVSTSLEVFAVFKLFLTLLVIVETLLCLTYVTVLVSPPESKTSTRAVVATVLAAASVGGWAALASSPL